ncbi:4Fe-4S dicluster domain-containing protein [Streptosporangium amethystogenes]|uniref:4Fe-4S dicluster domain-containing protein n=1 Tax=Streptosporangium amethystogenes TaxID=2002 RepID=UPI0037A56F2B
MNAVVMESLEPLVAGLRSEGFTVVGPTVRDGAIRFAELSHFCVSMGTGPKATAGFDLALTELSAPHRFLVETGSERGAEVVAPLPHRPAGDDDVTAAEEVSRVAATRMGRQVDTDNIQERLAEARDSPRWTEVASRCLACTNCTMVCPTCFCTTVEDATDFSGGEAERTEVWDSCSRWTSPRSPALPYAVRVPPATGSG